MFTLLVGAVVGAAICYYYLTTSKSHAEGTGSELNASRAELELRELRAEMARCKQENAQLKRLEEQLQEKSDECQSLAKKLSAAESQLPTAKEELKPPESEVRTLGDPHDEESPETEVPAEAEAVAEKAVEPPESEAGIIGDPHEEEETEAETTVEAEAEKSVEEPEVKDPEPEVEEPEAKAPEADAPPAKKKPDDLRKVEGIGPKVAQHLNSAGIMSFAQLAQTEVERLREILTAAGPAYKRMDPQTWPEQAELAAKGDWEALKVLQDKLDGGRYTS